jgi:hypothetical protein
MQEYLSAIHSMRTGIPVEMARQDIAVFGDGSLREQSRADAAAVVMGETRRAVEGAVADGSIENIHKLAEQDRVQQEIVANSRSPEVLAETLVNVGELWDSVSSRTAARDATIVKKLSEAFEGAEGGVLNWILDFTDIMVSFPFDVLVGGGFARADLAQTVQILRSADISEDEFNRTLDEAIEIGRDAGMFTNENALMLFGQIENIKQGGIGSEARLDKTFTILDAASIPSALSLVGRMAVRGLSGARNTTAVVGALRGPNAAGETLWQSLHKPGTEQAAAAGIPAHTLPGWLRHPDSGVDTQRWAAPGFNLAAKFEQDNLFLNTIRNFGFSQRINPAVFDAWRPEGLKALARELDATSSNNVLTMRIDTRRHGGSPYARR